VAPVPELASGKLIVDEPARNVTRIRISNPGKRGALDHEILDSLAATVRGQEARCIVITGDGPVFSAGYDLGNFPEPEFPDGGGLGSFSDEAEKLVAHPFTDAIEAIEEYPYPVIAAINGHAIGGGLEVAVACDIRIAARGIKLGMPPAKIGLIYSHTGLRRFIEACGSANTAELFFVGRNVDPQRAYEMGLVNHVLEPDEVEPFALEMAAEVGSNSPLSMSGNKEIMRTLRVTSYHPREDEARRLVRLRASCFTSADFVEGIRAFGEKRPADWSGR
jgi:enoyl-CoA hydratase/carnithine racemase